MSSIKWDAQELKLQLTPVGKPLGREKKCMSVFRDYGNPKQRVVQALAGMLGGDTVYIKAVHPVSPTRSKTIPVAGWRSSTIGTYIDYAASFIDRAMSCGMKVQCFGSRRETWELKVTTVQADEPDVTDNTSDRGSPGRYSTEDAVEDVEGNGIRRTF